MVYVERLTTIILDAFLVEKHSTIKIQAIRDPNFRRDSKYDENYWNHSFEKNASNRKESIVGW